MDLDRFLDDAIGDGEVERIRELVARGANVKHRDTFHRTPLIRAIAVGGIRLPEVVACLLELGAAVDAQNNKGMTALMEAALRNDVQVVHVLLRHGADPTLTDRTGRTALHFAGGDGKSLIAEALAERRRAAAAARPARRA